MLDESHHELLAEIASMYYEQDLTQNAIAEQLGLSRVKVYRLLKEAREHNVVQITIDYPMKRDAHLETRLKDLFQLKDAVVLYSGMHSRFSALQRLGKLTAHYVQRQLTHSVTMAVTLGSSTYEVINAIRPDFQAQVQVVQAIGSLPNAMHEYDSTALTRQLAQKLGGKAVYLTAPMMADSVEAAAVIRRQRDVHHTLITASQADLALVGIGNLDPSAAGIVRAKFVEDEELSALRRDGAVGDIAWQIYREDGSLYPTPLNARVIGITLDDLRKIPLTIAIAAGVEKSRAILGGLRAGVIDVLCTDDRTAADIIALV
ncbi:MAG: sugar-binding domain-containing protein [Anaerolineae bacterium]